MKTMIIKSLAMLVVTGTLLSFTFGAEGFEMFINNKLVARHFQNDPPEIKAVKLDAAAADEVLRVKYYNCRQIGKNRVFSLKNEQNKMVKEWRLADATAVSNAPVEMTCKVKDIIALNKGKEGSFKLYYSSADRPEGLLLANVQVPVNAIASLR